MTLLDLPDDVLVYLWDFIAQDQRDIVSVAVSCSRLHHTGQRTLGRHQAALQRWSVLDLALAQQDTDATEGSPEMPSTAFLAIRNTSDQSTYLRELRLDCNNMHDGRLQGYTPAASRSLVWDQIEESLCHIDPHIWMFYHKTQLRLHETNLLDSKEILMLFVIAAAAPYINKIHLQDCFKHDRLLRNVLQALAASSTDDECMLDKLRTVELTQINIHVPNQARCLHELSRWPPLRTLRVFAANGHLWHSEYEIMGPIDDSGYHARCDNGTLLEKELSSCVLEELSFTRASFRALSLRGLVLNSVRLRRFCYQHACVKPHDIEIWEPYEICQALWQHAGSTLEELSLTVVGFPASSRRDREAISSLRPFTRLKWLETHVWLLGDAHCRWQEPDMQYLIGGMSSRESRHDPWDLRTILPPSIETLRLDAREAMEHMCQLLEASVLRTAASYSIPRNIGLAFPEKDAMCVKANALLSTAGIEYEWLGPELVCEHTVRW